MAPARRPRPRPPGGDQGYAVERASVAGAARRLARLAAAGHRLLIVHGNGPLVGRLLRTDADARDLDLHVAQTQGELGYLLAEALEAATGQPAVAAASPSPAKATLRAACPG
jgi:carbamate kinase